MPVIVIIIFKIYIYLWRFTWGCEKSFSYTIKKKIVLYAIKMSHAEIIAYKGSI